MATGAPGTNGVWQYGEDDSETTFSALLNKVASTTNTQIGLDRGRLAILEQTGRVVQVVQASTSTPVTVSTGVATATGLSGTITPKYATSKILVIVAQSLQPVSLTNSYVAGFALNRAGLGWIDTGYLSANAAVGAGGAMAIKSINDKVILDSPATTSAVTYNTLTWIDSGYRVVAQEGNTVSRITLIEVTA